MDNLDKIVCLVRDMSPKQIFRELEGLSVDDRLLVRRLAEDLFYDRYICSALGIDYFGLNQKGVRKLELVAHYFNKNRGEE
jgi:hypothetical protein